jgi:hypothetical protein
MNKLVSTLLALAALGLATQLRATTTIFSDNFNSENGGVGFLNYGTPNQNGDGGAGSINTAFANWTVGSGGTVDLIPLNHISPTFGSDFNLTPGAGHGLYVDMDGTGIGVGTLTLRNPLSLGPGSYILSYDMAGNQREGAQDTVAIRTQDSVPTTIASQTQTLTETAPWTTYNLSFTLSAPTAVTIVFQDEGDADDIGNLLDNVVVTADGGSVPDGGATAGLLGMALLGLGALRRRLS